VRTGPIIPLNYYTPSRRIRWAIHRGLPAVLILFMICALIGWRIDHKRRQETEREVERLLHSGGVIVAQPRDSDSY